MNRRKFLAGGIAFAAGMSLPLRALAKVPEKELILCLDWSGSMYPEMPGLTQNYILQKEGHLVALKDPDVSQMLISGRVYVRVILWSGGMEEIVPIFKGRMESAKDVLLLTESIRNKVPDYRSKSGVTYHHTPLAYVASLSFFGKKRIIDISTDEPVVDWSSRYCLVLRDKLYRESNTTINVLAIGVNDLGIKNLRENLETPDGFTDSISDWGSYIPAIKKKIKKELSLV